MDKKDILREIIAHGGCCDWADGQASQICTICPLSQLATNDKGDFLSCMDAVKALDQDPLRIGNLKYQLIAERLLEEIEFEEAMLGE